MSDYSATSSFSDQMEQRNSTQNLSSRGSSEFGSQYLMESGLHIKSFAAAIFIAAMVTVGILFITLITTLGVMLQSCQNRNAGVLELQERSDQYNYCKIFALHADLNRLGVDEFPSICKAHVIQYIEGGQYLRDLNWTMEVVYSYFNNLKPQADGLDVVLLDVDDILTSNHPCHASPLQYRFNLYKESYQIEMHKLHSKLQAAGWSFVFITRKPEKLRNATIDTLICYGYGGWTSLIMRSDDEMRMESWEYFSRRRGELQDRGVRITSVISSSMDALTGPCLGKRVFKLPSSRGYKLDHHGQSS